MSDLEALAKLAQEATPGPWKGWTQGYADLEDQVAEVRAMLGKPDYPATDMAHVATADMAKEVALVGNGPNGQNNAAYIAAASPDVVLALVRVALAAREAVAKDDEYAEMIDVWPDLDPLRAALADLGD